MNVLPFPLPSLEASRRFPFRTFAAGGKEVPAPVSAAAARALAEIGEGSTPSRADVARWLSERDDRVTFALLAKGASWLSPYETQWVVGRSLSSAKSAGAIWTPLLDAIQLSIEHGKFQLGLHEQVRFDQYKQLRARLSRVSHWVQTHTFQQTVPLYAFRSAMVHSILAQSVVRVPIEWLEYSLSLHPSVMLDIQTNDPTTIAHADSLLRQLLDHGTSLLQADAGSTLSVIAGLLSSGLVSLEASARIGTWMTELRIRDAFGGEADRELDVIDQGILKIVEASSPKVSISASTLRELLGSCGREIGLAAQALLSQLETQPI